MECGIGNAEFGKLKQGAERIGQRRGDEGRGTMKDDEEPEVGRRKPDVGKIRRSENGIVY